MSARTTASSRARARARTRARLGVLAIVASALLAPPRADATPRGRTLVLEDDPGCDDALSGLDGADADGSDDDEGSECSRGRHDDELAPPGTQAATTPGPRVGEVLGAAYAAAGLDRDPGRGLARRARLAGLVPLVSVRNARTTSWRDGQLDVGHGSTVEIRATWRLDRLVFEGRELQVASLETARRRERRALASRVIRLYFQWKRAATRDRTGARALEAEAELDALTDGWFSAELDRRRTRHAGRRTAGGSGVTP